MVVAAPPGVGRSVVDAQSLPRRRGGHRRRLGQGRRPTLSRRRGRTPLATSAATRWPAGSAPDRGPPAATFSTAARGSSSPRPSRAGRGRRGRGLSLQVAPRRVWAPPSTTSGRRWSRTYPTWLASRAAARLRDAPDAAVALAGRDCATSPGSRSDPGLWTEILAANAAAVRDVLNALRADLDAVIGALAAAAATAGAPESAGPQRRPGTAAAYRASTARPDPVRPGAVVVDDRAGRWPPAVRRHGRRPASTSRTSTSSTAPASRSVWSSWPWSGAPAAAVLRRPPGPGLARP